MWSRESIVEEMAAALWETVAPAGSGRSVPRALFQAGEDLAKLFEATNHTSLSDIARRIAATEPGVDSEQVGAWLAEAACGESESDAAGALEDAGVEVPAFEIAAEQNGRDLEITWDGSPARRNPGQAGPRVMLLEDDPLLQEGTGRWLRKFYPDMPLIVVDNVDAAIANLKHHEMALIVSDVDVVGNKNGIDLFHYVQKHHPELVDKFVFFTGNSAAEREHYRYLAKGLQTSKDLKAVIDAPAPDAPATIPDAAPKAKRAKRQTKAAARAPIARADATVADVVAVIRDVAPRIQPVDGPDGRPKTRFGDRKIFISALWREASKDPRLEGMSFEQFKRMLLAAHRDRQLSMARADLVAAMDTGAVAASELAADGATFHFVVDPNIDSGIAAAPRPVVHQLSRPAYAAPMPTPTPSTADIVRAVLAAMPKIKAEMDEDGRWRGRVGGKKVFISAIWRIVSRQFPDLTRGQFDHALITAQRQGLLLLARLDVKNAARSEDTESEIQSLGATFHFVIDPDPNASEW